MTDPTARCEGVRDYRSIRPIKPCADCFHLWLASVRPDNDSAVVWIEVEAIVGFNGVTARVECPNYLEA